MGKQAPKRDVATNNSRRHNKSTKGNNTRKKGALWALRQCKVKDKKTEESSIEVLEVRVPVGAVWNPELMGKKFHGNLPEPFDALHLEWMNEIIEYIADINNSDGVSAKIRRTGLSNGWYNYDVIRKIEKEDEEILWSIESKQNLNFGPVGKFSKRKR